MRTLAGALALLVVMVGCGSGTAPAGEDVRMEADVQAISLLGRPLRRPADVNPAHRANLETAREAWEADAGEIDNWIWYGRRLAYTGDHRAAIEVFSQAIDRFPGDARLYRHRGHRHITLRAFDRAVADLEVAVRLIADRPDEIEPDGLPNAQNIPLSTLHGNIWYHLGLAYYLRNEMEAALSAYRRSLEAAGNDEMRVACQYWLYMILRRLERHREAEDLLAPLPVGLDLLENVSYYRLCLFFKGAITLEELRTGADGLVDYMFDAIEYGVGNWHFFSGRPGEAARAWRAVLEQANWAGFAGIAAEADYARFFAGEGSGR